MYLWAVSLALVAFGSSPEQAREMDSAYRPVAPSVVRLRDGNVPVGSAVLIDPNGYFLAQRSAGNSRMLTGVTSNGESFLLTRVSTDEASGLVLLQASSWHHPEVNPIRTIVNAPQKGTPVIVVMSGALEAGEVSNPNRSGVLPQSKRLVFLTEIKLENPTPNLGGAPVFTYQGEFVGLLNANLESSSTKHTTIPLSALAQKLSHSIQSAVPVLQSRTFREEKHYGPSQLFVAYSLGPEMLQRVISGFLSSSHQVVHPFIGLYVRDTDRGAEVQAISPNSPASDTDLHVGDLILSVGGSSIANRIDYAHSLMHLRAGERVKVVYLRHGQESSTEVTIGRAAN